MRPADRTFFAAYGGFLETHDPCPDGPTHLRIHVWLPTGRPECAVALTCICGTRVVLDATRAAGAAIVAASRLNGVPVTESTEAHGLH